MHVTSSPSPCPCMVTMHLPRAGYDANVFFLTTRHQYENITDRINSSCMWTVCTHRNILNDGKIICCNVILAINPLDSNGLQLSNPTTSASCSALRCDMFAWTSFIDNRISLSWSCVVFQRSINQWLLCRYCVDVHTSFTGGVENADDLLASGYLCNVPSLVCTSNTL